MSNLHCLSLSPRYGGTSHRGAGELLMIGLSVRGLNLIPESTEGSGATGWVRRKPRSRSTLSVARLTARYREPGGWRLLPFILDPDFS
jgi:hypothetical protein